MPYRSDVQALRARCEALERTLEDLRARTGELARLKQSEADAERELSVARRQLDSLREGPSLPHLAALRVASPCHASWASMIGDDRVRFCASCSRSVYNVSAMESAEAEALLCGEGELCVRFYKRADGTVMTADCPEGARKKRTRRVAAALALGGGLFGTSAAAMAPRTTLGARVPAARIEPELHQGAKYEMRPEVVRSTSASDGSSGPPPE
jgi:hypothetical protein